MDIFHVFLVIFNSDVFSIMYFLSTLRCDKLKLYQVSLKTKDLSIRQLYFLDCSQRLNKWRHLFEATPDFEMLWFISL